MLKGSKLPSTMFEMGKGTCVELGRSGKFQEIFGFVTVIYHLTRSGLIGI